MVLLKFVAETYWLGDGSNASLGGGAASGEGGDTICRSASEGYRDILSALSPSPSTARVNPKAAIVIPLPGTTEPWTVEGCAQSRLFASDVNRSTITEEGEPTSTLLECYNSRSPGLVFLDPTMTVNCFDRLGPSFVKEWRDEAARAVRSLHGHSDDPSSSGGGGGRNGGPFQALFLENCRFYRRYDAYVRLHPRSVPFPPNLKGGALWGVDVDDLGRYESLSRGVLRIRTATLGDRLAGGGGAIRVLTAGDGEIEEDDAAAAGSGSCGGGAGGTGGFGYSIPVRGSEGERSEWAGDGALSPLAMPSPSLSNPDGPSAARASDRRRSHHMVLGLQIDPTLSRRAFDRGPPANGVTSSPAFVSLWGESKANLRRFRDGAIVRAVLWNDPSEEDSRDEGGDYMAYAGDDRGG